MSRGYLPRESISCIMLHRYNILYELHENEELWYLNHDGDMKELLVQIGKFLGADGLNGILSVSVDDTSLQIML